MSSCVYTRSLLLQSTEQCVCVCVCVCVYKEVAGVSSMGEVSKEAGGQGLRDESALFKGPSRGQTEKWRI